MLRAMRALLLPFLLLAGPGLAHSELRGSDPPDNARLSGPPAAIVLRFNEPVQVTALRLQDGAGAPVGLRRAARRDPAPSERAEPTAALPPGSYRLEWRAISADGHPIRGVLRFTVLPP